MALNHPLYCAGRPTKTEEIAKCRSQEAVIRKTHMYDALPCDDQNS